MARLSTGLGKASTRALVRRRADRRLARSCHRPDHFYGVRILADPIFFARIGVRIPLVATIGPRRLTTPALAVKELPPIDLILLSHAHFDHFDLRSLHRFGRKTQVITAARTRDLLRFTRLRQITELTWNESREIAFAAGPLKVTAFKVKHWGARMHFDHDRGYNGYVLERSGHRVLFGGDSAFTPDFAAQQRERPVDLAIVAIGCYDPWIANHATPEEAIHTAAMTGARFIMPVHHQTFRLSFEPLTEPIERFVAALQETPEKIALRQIAETFVLPRD